MQSICFYGKSKPKTFETLNRLLNLAEDNNSQSHTNKNDELIMIVFPPNNATGYVTDEDSGDEDGWGKLIICLQVCSWHKQNLKIVLTMTVMMKLKTMALISKKKERKSVLCKRQKSNMKNDLPQWTPGDDKIKEPKANNCL